MYKYSAENLFICQGYVDHHFDEKCKKKYQTDHLYKPVIAGSQSFIKIITQQSLTIFHIA